MHLKRQQATKKLPIPRKGSTYVARALAYHNNSVPVVIAVRDMLKLARTTAEVKKMIHQKLLKINGRIVKEFRQPICLFHIFEADKPYTLTLLPTGKFTFSPSSSSSRLVKVTNKKLLSHNTIQINLHDGSNLISKDKINVGDSLYIDFKGKIQKHVPLEKSREVFIMGGKYIGKKGKIQAVECKQVTLHIEGKKEPVNLHEQEVIVQ